MKTIKFPNDTEVREIYDETARNSIGNLSNLNTSNKDNIVNAINEVDASIDSLTGEMVNKAPLGHTHTKSQITDFPSTETWTFTLEDGSTVTKAVYVGEVPMATVTFASTGSSAGNGNATATINGVTYGPYSRGQTIEVPIGTNVDCYASVGNYSGSYNGGKIYVNGTVVADGQSAQASQSYTYAITGDTTIELNSIQSGMMQYGEVKITEQ